jgi:hypothetical protein
MNKPRAWKNAFRAAARVSVIILVALLVFGVVLIPVVGSSAQMIEQLAYNPHLPLILKNANLGPTRSITPSPSATVTGTVPTPTSTATFGPSPTNTLTPSATFTGTLTTIPGLTIGVSGSPAKVNQSLIFTINVTNSGTGPTRNNILVDAFATYLDVSNVTTTMGSVNRQSHSFVVSIGNVNPGVVVTIVATVKVNNTLTKTETTSNNVTLTYNETLTKNASVSYTVQYQTLPGTGQLPLNWRESSVKPAGLIPG